MTIAPRQLGRDPQQETRTRRFMELCQALFNRMLQDGTLVQVGVGEYGLIGLLYTGHGAPPSTLGYTGDYYLDLSAGVLYKLE